MYDEEYDPDFPEGPAPYPMHFVAQIDLSELPFLNKEALLPKEGTCSSFSTRFRALGANIAREVQAVTLLELTE